MGGRSSKTKPGATQPDTLVESLSPGDAADEVARAGGEQLPAPRQSSHRLVKEIWSVGAATGSALPQSSPKKRSELQISSEEDSDAGLKLKSLAKKKGKKKRRKGSREQDPVPKPGAVKLNEVQVIKKPPADVSVERQQRFEEIKVAYSIRDLAPRMTETPSPSRAETKAESLARFYAGRESNPGVTPVIRSVTQPKVGESATSRPSSGCSPSYQSESSPRQQLTQSKDEQVLQFNARHSERDSTELLDIDELEREESAAVTATRSPVSSFQRTTLTPVSKATESRFPSLPTTQSSHSRLIKSPAHSLRLDDVDESIMSAILMEMPPRTGGTRTASR